MVDICHDSTHLRFLQKFQHHLSHRFNIYYSKLWQISTFVFILPNAICFCKWKKIRMFLLCKNKRFLKISLQRIECYLVEEGRCDDFDYLRSCSFVEWANNYKGATEVSQELGYHKVIHACLLKVAHNWHKTTKLSTTTLTFVLIEVQWLSDSSLLAQEGRNVG